MVQKKSLIPRVLWGASSFAKGSFFLWQMVPETMMLSQRAHKCFIGTPHLFKSNRSYFPFGAYEIPPQVFVFMWWNIFPGDKYPSLLFYCSEETFSPKTAWGRMVSLAHTCRLLPFTEESQSRVSKQINSNLADGCHSLLHNNCTICLNISLVGRNIWRLSVWQSGGRDLVRHMSSFMFLLTCTSLHVA